MVWEQGSGERSADDTACLCKWVLGESWPILRELGRPGEPRGKARTDSGPPHFPSHCGARWIHPVLSSPQGLAPVIQWPS